MDFPKVPGVVVSLSPTESERVFVLDVISVPRAKRRMGYGTEAMRVVLQWADDNGFIIGLNPTNDLGTPTNVLVKWYGGFGFMPNAGKVGATRAKMIRYPHGGLRDLPQCRYLDN